MLWVGIWSFNAKTLKKYCQIQSFFNYPHLNET